MVLFNLSTARRGRPRCITEIKPQPKKALTNLEKLYMLRRIDKFQMQHALSFKRLAISVFPAMGAPNIANECHRRGTGRSEDEIAFALWKEIMLRIERCCGHFLCEVMIKTIVDDVMIPGLIDDIDIMSSMIKKFCVALDLVGEVLAD